MNLWEIPISFDNGRGVRNNMLKRFLIALFAVAVLLPITATKADASLIKNAYVTMSVPTSTTANVTHTYYWINHNSIFIISSSKTSY